jgi:glycerophosphoryl diester phosphodiesterase
LNLLRGDGPLLRIGHRGAAAIAPPNTLAAIEAALELGVDMVELDVLGRPDRTLVLGHSRKELEAEPGTLDDALALLAKHPSVGLVADIKSSGHERELAEALRRHRLLERSVASTNRLNTLHALRRLDPALALSRTYPRDRLHLGRRRTLIPIVGPVLLALRLALPFRVAGFLEEAGASAITLHRKLVTRAAVERCHRRGFAVLVWTVNDAAQVRRFDSLGVDGVITDDPRVFGASRATLQA